MTSFAERLIAATTEERQSLVESNRGAINVELVRELQKLANGLENSAKYAQGLAVEQFILSMAEGLGDREGQEAALHAVGFFASQMGRLEEAAEAYRRAIVIGEERKDDIRVVRHLFELSVTLTNLGEYDEGRRYGYKAVELSAKASSPTDQARARNALGKSFREVGRYADALQQYQLSMEIAEREKLGAGIAYLANNLGGLYADLGNYPLALRYYQRSLKIKEDLKDPNLSTTLDNLGGVYHQLGRDAEAIQALERGLASARTLGKMFRVTEVLRTLATVERDQRKFVGAMAHLQEAAAIAIEIKARDNQAQILHDMASTELAAGKATRALELALRAAALFRELSDESQLGRALETAGDAALRAGQRTQARAYYLEAIASYDKLREQAAGGAESRELFFEGMVSPYQNLALIDATAGQIESAFEFAEQAKARVLAEVLESGHTPVTRSMTDEEQAQEKRLRVAMQRASAGVPRTAARLDYQVFENTLYARHPELRLHRVQADLLPAARAVSVLPDRQTALLQYLVTPQETLLFTVTRDRGIRLFRIVVSESQLRKQVDAYREMAALKDLNYQASARALNRLMLAPAAAELNGRTKMVILPDGPLWQLPFQALTDTDGRFVAEKYQISYAPSVTVLASLAQRKTSPFAGLRLLAMAHGLPEAEEEARTLGNLYGASARVYTGPAAQEAVFKQQAPGFGILHLASHGVLENASPMYSYVALAKDTTEDGRLEAAELINMDLKARLVVLSACDTGRGRIGAGEGVLGLTWALAVAGVPTTIASGWKVDSKATAELMIELHRGLRSGLSPAAALRKSAMQLMARPEYRHPFYWGSFAVFGLGW